MYYDIAIIGGGPAGSSLATYLARSGKKVVVFEKSTFPRFHVGESLLPATMPILQDLGVYEEMCGTFLNKPGGCWYYDEIPLTSDFAKCTKTASFNNYRHALMVERSEFDRILLDNAQKHNSQIFERHIVKDLIWEKGKLKGLQVIDLNTEEKKNIFADMVFDCSGYHSVIASKLKLRQSNGLRKMAIFAHYEAEALEERLKKGWFVGQMIYDGWLWLIPISKNRISIGLVTTLDNYKKAKISPEEFLDEQIQKTALVTQGIDKTIIRVSKVHLYGNLGYSSKKVFGDGWALVGDAAAFIDPCYSTGVHLAMESAQKIAKLYLENYSDRKALYNALADYERKFHQHEKLVLMLVNSFYMASRSKLIRKIVCLFAKIPFMNRKFVNLVGGDFADESLHIKMTYQMHRLFSVLTSNRTYQFFSKMTLSGLQIKIDY